VAVYEKSEHKLDHYIQRKQIKTGPQVCCTKAQSYWCTQPHEIGITEPQTRADD